MKSSLDPGSSWLSGSNFNTLSSNIPNFYVIFHELLNICCFTAICGVFMAGVHRDCGPPVFTSAWGVILYISYVIERHWQCQLGQCSINPQVSVPASMLQAPRVETMLKDSLCVFSLIIQWELNTAVHCVSWVYLALHFSIMYFENWMSEVYVLYIIWHFWQGVTLWTACAQTLFQPVYKLI